MLTTFMGVGGGGGAPALPDTILSYWAEDATVSAWPNRGLVGASADLALVGTGVPVVGTDATGPHVTLAGTHRYETASTFASGYAGSDWTIAILHDGGGGTSFLFDFIKSGARLTGRHRTGINFDILDSAYRNYQEFGSGLHYEVFVLSGAAGNGYLKDDVADSNNPVTYDARVIDTVINMAIGALHGGTSPFTGKVRAISIAAKAWDASERAQAQAAHEAVWTL